MELMNNSKTESIKTISEQNKNWMEFFDAYNVPVMSRDLNDMSYIDPMDMVIIMEILGNQKNNEYKEPKDDYEKFYWIWKKIHIDTNNTKEVLRKMEEYCDSITYDKLNYHSLKCECYNYLSDKNISFGIHCTKRYISIKNKLLQVAVDLSRFGVLNALEYIYDLVS